MNAAALTELDAVAPADIDLRQVIENILHVLPDTKNVQVVLGASPLEKFWLAETQQAFGPYSDRVRFTWLPRCPPQLSERGNCCTTPEALRRDEANCRLAQAHW